MDESKPSAVIGTSGDLEFLEKFRRGFDHRSLRLENRAVVANAECVHTWNSRDCGMTFCDLCGVNCKRDIAQNAIPGTQPDASVVQRRRLSDKSVMAELLRMNYPRSICEMAASKFHEITKGKAYRCKSRKALVCVCVFAAQQTLGTHDDYGKLQTRFKVPNRKMLQGLKRLCFQAPGASSGQPTEPVTFSVSVDNIIRNIMNYFISSERNVAEALEVLHSVRDRTPLLARSRPQSLAASVVYYWIVSTNRGISLEDFRAYVNLSSATILRIQNEIAMVLASETCEKEKTVISQDSPTSMQPGLCILDATGTLHA